MRYLIRCDMEGLTGVTRYEEVWPGSPLYPEFRAMLTNDLLAVIEGLRAGDPAADVLLYDEHVDGRNVDLAALPAYCQAVVGKPRYTATDPGAAASGIDALVMVGFHAMAGAAGGTLAHSYEHDIQRIEVNGRLVGELGVEAGIAGELGVPLILYTGDSAGAREAEALVPGVACGVVKESLGENACRSLSAAASREMLRDLAAQTAAAPERWPGPLRLGQPVTLAVDLAAGAYCARFAELHPEVTTDGRQVVIQAPSLAAAWAEYWERKDAALASLGGPDH